MNLNNPTLADPRHVSPSAGLHRSATTPPATPTRARTTPAPAAESISLVNLSARQRMLSQRMLLQAVLAARADPAQLQAAAASLKLFSDSHARLMATASEFEAADAQRIRDTYHGPRGVAPRIEEFVRRMRDALQAIGQGDLQPTGLDALVADNDAVLEALNTATTTFDTLNKRKDMQLMKALTDIVSDIQKVALEAKIVSFNAQVLAARAGQHGREFSVVAGVLSGISVEIDTLASDAMGLAARTAQPS